MTPPSMKCVLGMRDAGIDAMAALTSVFAGLRNGFTEQEARELKDAFGSVIHVRATCCGARTGASSLALLDAR